ncbi:MAG: nucleotidyltransferase family protein [Clostridiales bacterium]|nr:nucleotidyltransferase family protein [Clostridiales bacterium]
MKICAVVCEYNPFHNGHAYQLAEARRLSGCDKLLCIMSGNFTQRGEMAVFSKFSRARHAILSGADAVIELPAPFAVAPAELFSEGAIHILSSIPAVEALAFGCERGDKESFLRAATALCREDKEYKAALKENMKGGTSYKVAQVKTALALNEDVDEALLTSPNNVLGTLYCRAILKRGAHIEPLPIPRVGGGYADTAPLKNFSSATALRACMRENSRKNKKILKSNLPPAVCSEQLVADKETFEKVLMSALLLKDAEEIAKTPDCSEGLENRLRAMAKSNPDYDDMLAKIVTKRYTLSRLRRILLENALGIYQKDVKNYLETPLYYRVLAVKKESAEELLAALGEGKFSVVARKSDVLALKKDAAACFETDVRANDFYNVLTGIHTNEYLMQLI